MPAFGPPAGTHTPIIIRLLCLALFLAIAFRQIRLRIIFWMFFLDLRMCFFKHFASNDINLFWSIYHNSKMIVASLPPPSAVSLKQEKFASHNICYYNVACKLCLDEASKQIGRSASCTLEWRKK